MAEETWAACAVRLVGTRDVAKEALGGEHVRGDEPRCVGRCEGRGLVAAADGDDLSSRRGGLSARIASRRRLSRHTAHALRTRSSSAASSVLCSSPHDSDDPLTSAMASPSTQKRRKRAGTLEKIEYVSHATRFNPSAAQQFVAGVTAITTSWDPLDHRRALFLFHIHRGTGHNFAQTFRRTTTHAFETTSGQVVDRVSGTLAGFEVVAMGRCSKYAAFCIILARLTSIQRLR